MLRTGGGLEKSKFGGMEEGGGCDIEGGGTVTPGIGGVGGGWLYVDWMGRPAGAVLLIVLMLLIPELLLALLVLLVKSGAALFDPPSTVMASPMFSLLSRCTPRPPTVDMVE